MLTVVIGIHIAAGLTAVIAGLTAMLAPKRAGRHPRSGHVFLVAVGVVFATALGIVAAVPTPPTYLSPAASPCSPPRRVSPHDGSAGAAGSATTSPPWASPTSRLLTTFYVDNGPKLPLWNLLPRSSFWILPAAIGLPLIARAAAPTLHAEADNGPEVRTTDDRPHPSRGQRLRPGSCPLRRCRPGRHQQEGRACCGTASTIGSDETTPAPR